MKCVDKRLIEQGNDKKNMYRGCHRLVSMVDGK